jgi:hypothetical protein
VSWVQVWGEIEQINVSGYVDMFQRDAAVSNGYLRGEWAREKKWAETRILTLLRASQPVPLSAMRHFFCLFTSLFLIGCSGNMPLDSTFKQSRSAKVAVVTMKAPLAAVHYGGGQGILDIALNQAISADRTKMLHHYPSQARLDGVGTRLANRLRLEGYKATHLDFHPNLSEFEPYAGKTSGDKPIPGVSTHLKGYDAVLFLCMPAVGQFQKVYGVIPLSFRNPHVIVYGALLSVPDGRRLWRKRPPDEIQDDEYPEENSNMDQVFRAIDSIVARRASELEADFFRGF